MKAKGAPVVKDEKRVRALVGSKFLKWLGDGYYKRNTSKPKNKKTLRKKKKTIEEIFENLIYD